MSIAMKRDIGANAVLVSVFVLGLTSGALAQSAPALQEVIPSTPKVADIEETGDYIAPDDESMLYLQTKINVLEEQLDAANHQIVALTTAMTSLQARHSELFRALLEAGVIRVERDDP